LVVLIVVSSCATGKKAHTKEDEELCGKWVNPEYETNYSHPVIYIYTADGKWIAYNKQADTKPWRQGLYTIIDKWTDSEGNIWYKLKFKNTMTGGSGYYILKVSNHGNTLEQVWEHTENIEFSTEHRQYRIFSRQ
jgi:hypothetical protein